MIKRKDENMKQVKWKDFLMLQAVFAVYSISSVVAKFASANEMMSFKFVLFYGLDVLILGIYALLWQQVIKRFELSVAYANKAITLLWALIWGILIFREQISIGKVLGILLVMAGIFILNSGEDAA